MVWLKALWHFIGVGKVITWEGFLIFSFKAIKIKNKNNKKREIGFKITCPVCCTISEHERGAFNMCPFAKVRGKMKLHQPSSTSTHAHTPPRTCSGVCSAVLLLSSHCQLLFFFALPTPRHFSGCGRGGLWEEPDPSQLDCAWGGSNPRPILPSPRGLQAPCWKTPP